MKWTVVTLYTFGMFRHLRAAADPSRDKPASPGVYAMGAVLCTLLALGVAVLL